MQPTQYTPSKCQLKVLINYIKTATMLKIQYILMNGEQVNHLKLANPESKEDASNARYPQQMSDVWHQKR